MNPPPPRSRRAEARDPATPPARLHELSRAGCAREVAANPNTPTALLLKLAARHFDAFLANPVLPLLILEDPGFCQKIPASALRRLLRREKLPEHFLESLTRHPDREVSESARLHLARREVEPDSKAVLFSSLCAEPVSSGLLGTLLRLRMVPLWLREALAGSLHPDLRDRVIRSFRNDTEPGSGELWNLYGNSGMLKPAPESKRVALSPGLTPEQLTCLARGGPRARRAAAEHIQTPPAILRRLTSDPVRAVALAALRNRSTPSEALWARAGNPDAAVRMAILANPAAPEVLIEQLAADPLPQVRAAALRHRLINPAALDRLAADPDANVRRTVARHRAVSPATLAKLAHDADWQVVEAAATRPWLPQTEVDRLLATGSIAYLKQIARRRDLSEEQLITLLCSEHSIVRQYVRVNLPRHIDWKLPEHLLTRTEMQTALRETGWHPRPRQREWRPPAPPPLPKWRPRSCRWRPQPSHEEYQQLDASYDEGVTGEDFTLLLVHPDPDLRASAAQNHRAPPQLLHQLAGDPEDSVRQRLAFNRGLLPETVSILVSDPNPLVRQCVAFNRELPATDFARLATDSSPGVRSSIMSNPHAPEEIIRALAADPVPKVRDCLCHNANAPGDLLEIAWHQPGAPREVLLRHRNIPRHLLESGLSSPRLVERQAAAGNPALTAADLEHLAASSESSLHTAAASHPRMTPDLAARFAASGTPAILAALAGNAHSPHEILDALARHPSLSAEVRCALQYNTSLPAESLEAMVFAAPPGEKAGFVHCRQLSAGALLHIAAHLPARQESSAWYGLLANPAITPALLEELYRKAHPDIHRIFSHAAGKHPSFQLLLIREADANTRTALAWNTGLTAEAMLALAADPVHQVRQTLSRNARLTRPAMLILLQNARGTDHCDYSIRAAIALHPRTPQELRLTIALEELARFQPSSGTDGLYGQQRRKGHSLRRLSRGGQIYASDNAGILLGLLLRPDLPTEIFAPLLDSTIPDINHALLDRPDLPAEWRERIHDSMLCNAATHHALLIRLCALVHPRCPAAALHKAATGRWLERYALTQNPACPPDLLQLLTQDSNTLVRGAAEEALQRSSS